MSSLKYGRRIIANDILRQSVSNCQLQVGALSLTINFNFHQRFSTGLKSGPICRLCHCYYVFLIECLSCPMPYFALSQNFNVDFGLYWQYNVRRVDTAIRKQWHEPMLAHDEFHRSSIYFNWHLSCWSHDSFQSALCNSFPGVRAIFLNWRLISRLFVSKTIP